MMEQHVKEALGESAFPVNSPCGTAVGTGLSKRELFAAMAMQGILANPEYVGLDVTAECNDETIAGDSVKLADALLSALAPQESQEGAR